MELPGYRILRAIAAGGMGSVYEAERLTTHERFAVKFIRGHLLGDPVYYARFEREVSALRAIRHSNVVDLFDWHLPPPDSGEIPFVVMELLKGESLEGPLKRAGRLPHHLAVQVMLQALDGLAAAHSVGVIHRDLGPSNIFLIPETPQRVHVKLLDFGLARPLEEGSAHAGVTQEGTWMGKPAYVAPELLLNLPLDERADLFACGMVLFRMLAGRFPYRETNSQLLWMERYAEREQPPAYPPVSEFQADVPEPLVAIVAKAVAKKRDERYASARQMQTELLQFERQWVAETSTETSFPALALVHQEPTGSSVIAGRSSTIQQGARRRLRPPVIAAGIVGLALVVALVIVFAGRSGRGPSQPAATADVPVPVLAAVPDAGDEPDGAGGKASPAEPVAVADAARPAADAGGPEAEPAAAPVEDAAAAVSDTVRLSLQGVPPGAELRVDGVLAPQAGFVELARSARAVRLAVTVPGGRYEPWVQSVIPDDSRTVEVQLRRVRRPGGATTRDAGATRGADAGLQGRFGTVFSTDYDDEP
ncbi:MAG: serine/threonine protein kinase [Deltaproteobacteria bacterium]|nr:serine/threonine protein kinase [Deltaproteobacteria bacterium]